MKAELIPCRMEIISKATPRNCVCESQPSFCSTSAVPKMGNTYSIPPFSELHTVFLHFRNFELEQKSCLRLLAELCGAALN